MVFISIIFVSTVGMHFTVNMSTILNPKLLELLDVKILIGTGNALFRNKLLIEYLQDIYNIQLKTYDNITTDSSFGAIIHTFK